MPSSKHLPFAILVLILTSALAVLVLGFRFAKEDKVVTIERDRAPLAKFTTNMLREVESLDKLYQNHLIDIRDQIKSNTSSIKIASICRRIAGIEQATIFRKTGAPTHLDLRETERSSPLPHPRESGDASSDGGIIIDTKLFEKEVFADNYRWINRPGHPPHFLAELDYKSILVLRINPKEVTTEANDWMLDWLQLSFDQIESSGIPTIVQSPDGTTIATSGKIDANAAPNLLLPIPSNLGDWKISSWALKETVTSYRQPVLIGSAALAVILALAGIFGYNQQKRATHLAEQRVSFVNRVSHELRTPMTNILLNVDLLSDSIDEDSPGPTKRLGLIREEASRLSRLLENVLTFSEQEKAKASVDISQQNLRIVSCNVSDLINKVVSQFSPTLSRKGIAVHLEEIDSHAFALADPDALCQIISNLISNVEKYASDGGKLEITVEKSSSKNEVIVSVVDFGPGIPQSETSRIFRPFVRLNDSTTEGVSGTGLGLAIARDLAEGMNGKLEIAQKRKRKTNGSRFNLILPLSADNIVSIAS